MGFEEIRIAVESRMTSWNGVAVEYDGTKVANTDDPNDKRPVTNAIRANEPWVRLTIQHGTSLTAGIGSGPCVRRTGLIMLQVFTPLNAGSRPAAMLADSLAQHWEYFQQGPLETQAASVQRVGPDDDYYQYNVSLPFRAG